MAQVKRRKPLAKPKQGRYIYVPVAHTRSNTTSYRSFVSNANYKIKNSYDYLYNQETKDVTAAINSIKKLAATD